MPSCSCPGGPRAVLKEMSHVRPHLKSTATCREELHTSRLREDARHGRRGLDVGESFGITRAMTRFAPPKTDPLAWTSTRVPAAERHTVRHGTASPQARRPPKHTHKTGQERPRSTATSGVTISPWPNRTLGNSSTCHDGCRREDFDCDAFPVSYAAITE